MALQAGQTMLPITQVLTHLHIVIDKNGNPVGLALNDNICYFLVATAIPSTPGAAGTGQPYLNGNFFAAS